MNLPLLGHECFSSSHSLILYARIQDPVYDVGEEIGGDYAECYYVEYCLHNWKVLPANRVPYP